MTSYVVRYETESQPYLPDEGQMYQQVTVDADDEETAREKFFILYGHESPELIDIWEEGESEAGEEVEE